MGMVMAKWTSQEQPADVGFWASRASSRAHLLGTWPSLAEDAGKPSPGPAPELRKRSTMLHGLPHPDHTSQPMILKCHLLHSTIHFIHSTNRAEPSPPFQAPEPGKARYALKPPCLLAVCPRSVVQPSQPIFSISLLPHSKLFLLHGGRSHFIPGFSLFH